MIVTLVRSGTRESAHIYPQAKEEPVVSPLLQPQERHMQAGKRLKYHC